MEISHHQLAQVPWTYLKAMKQKFKDFGGCGVLKGMKFKGFQMVLKVWHDHLE